MEICKAPSVIGVVTEFTKRLLKRIILASVTTALLADLAGAQESKAIFHQGLDWSPDGQYLSFTGMTDYDAKTDHYVSSIYIVKADGSNLQRISPADRNVFSSSWSKDGQRIVSSVTTQAQKEADIFTVSKEGTGLVQLTKHAGRNVTPAFSPDAKRIAFVSNRDGDKYQIYVMKTDGSGVTRLTANPELACFNPMWSPDGRKIVYYSERGDRRDQVWIMKADGSQQTLLTGGIGHNIYPSFSADGRRILFSSSNRDGGNASYVEGSYLYIMDADGSNLKPLSHIQSFFARFSPDGRRLAFIAGKFPESKIYLADADGGNQKVLDTQPLPARSQARTMLREKKSPTNFRKL
jgi:TolB protein